MGKGRLEAIPDPRALTEPRPFIADALQRCGTRGRIVLLGVLNFLLSPHLIVIMSGLLGNNPKRIRTGPL